jgi:hypothetical protein
MNSSATVFIERHFELRNMRLTAQLHQPIEAPGGEYRCRWELIWPDGSEAGEAPGMDAVQAMLHALRLVHDRLLASKAYQTGEITLWGQLDLELPPGWGGGSLYPNLEHKNKTCG